MIVLIVLAGALAIAWPGLQRSLNRIPLDEGSQTIREAIDESRQKAISNNRPMLIRFRKDEHEVQTGTVESFMEEEEDRPQTWKLSNDVIVVNVKNKESSFNDNQIEWWIPLDAQGIGINTEITLRDKATNKNIYVSYSASTGSVEISR